MNANPVDIPADAAPAQPMIEVAPSPHLADPHQSTRRMMVDVLVALAPVALAAVYVFHWHAVRQILICVAACTAAEALFARLRGRRAPLDDCSAAVTGAILALSLPATAPWYTALIGSLVAVGIGKALFGGLGMNLFNPAMVGRAFAMISFAGALGAAGYQDPHSRIDAITQATPLTAWQQSGVVADLADLFWGTTNGSLGETSALACLVGGLYLCLRRTAAWQIPVSMLAVAGLLSLPATGFDPSGWSALHHLCGGAMLFGAFFIATDPVSASTTPRGQLIFGALIGFFVFVIRTWGGYPDAVAFAVLLMNMAAPTIDHYTQPKVFGARETKDA